LQRSSTATLHGKTSFNPLNYCFSASKEYYLTMEQVLSTANLSGVQRVLDVVKVTKNRKNGQAV